MLSIPDKFKIIRTTDYDTTINADKLSNFLENIILNNNLILSSDIIHQFLWFNKNDNLYNEIEDIIINVVKKFLRKVKNGFNNAKRYILKLYYINKFLNDYKDKLFFIRNTFINFDNYKKREKNIYDNITNKYYFWGKSYIVEQGIKLLTTFLFSEPIIKNILLHEAKNMSDTSLIDFERFSNYMYIFGNYNTAYYEWFINIIQNTLTELIPFNTMPIKIELYDIYNFSSNYNFYTKIKKYYKFIKNKNIFNGIIDILYNNINNIFINSEPLIIFYWFNKFNQQIENIIQISNNNDKKEYNNKLILQIINFLNKYENEIELNYNNINNIIQLYNNLYNIFKIPNMKDNLDLIRFKIQNIIINDDNLELIHRFINQKIILEQTESFTCLFQLLEIINNKDEFIEKYYQYLIKRLLNKYPINIEYNIIYIIKEYFCNDKYLYKLRKAIKDVENSNSLNNNFIDMQIFENLPINTIITSYNTWDINLKEGHLESNELNKIVPQSFNYNTVLKSLYCYNKFYNISYKNKRKLIWYLHVGELNITFTSNKQNTELILLPLHGLVLDLFYSNKAVNYDDLINQTFFKQYNDKIKNGIVQSLIDAEIIMINSKKLCKLNILYGGPDKINIIELYYNIINYKEEFIKYKKEELAHSRKHIISSCINHFIKQKKYSYQELFDVIKQNITIFDVNAEIFEHTIKWMIEREYISNNKQIITKYL